MGARVRADLLSGLAHGLPTDGHVRVALVWGAGWAENGGVPGVASLIELSRKTGLPRGVLPEKDKKEKGEET